VPNIHEPLKHMAILPLPSWTSVLVVEEKAPRGGMYPLSTRPKYQSIVSWKTFSS